MPEIKDNLENKKEEHCIECTVGLDDCVDCGACDHCDHDATLDEAELPPNWLKFIERSKTLRNK